MKKIRALLCAAIFGGLCTISLLFAQNSEQVFYKKFVFVIASYNNAQWYQRNLDSVFAQQYPYFRVLYFDDASPDGTGQLVEDYIQAQRQERVVKLVRNAARCGALKNIYTAIHEYCSDDEIVVMLDGDDWLAHPQVLSILNRTYADLNVWLTYGQFKMYPTDEVGKCQPYPQEVIKHNTFREYPWIASHLRTCYAWLFKKIKVQDLQLNGTFFAMTWDQALMFPMLEMAAERVRCISEVLYVYNIANPINDQNVNPVKQVQLGNVIRRMPKYTRLVDIMISTK